MTAATYFETIAKTPAAQAVWQSLSACERELIEFRFFELHTQPQHFTFHPDIVLRGRQHYYFSIHLGFGELLCAVSHDSGNMGLIAMCVDRAELHVEVASPQAPN